MRKFDENKVYQVRGPMHSNTHAHAMDDLIIGYKGVGEAPLPASLISELMAFPPKHYSPGQLMQAAIIHSQYVQFEKV